MKNCSVNKKVVLTGPREIKVEDEPVEVPKGDEVLVRMLYSGISAGTEMNVYRGDAPFWSSHQDPDTGLFRSGHPQFTYPLAYGSSGVGIVNSVGPDAADRRPGQLVAVSAPHQSWPCVPIQRTTVLPELDDPRVGVFLPSAIYALNAALDAHISFGDVVVVSGLGVLGLLIVSLMHRSGAAIVIGVTGRKQRRELAMELGADYVLEPAQTVPEFVRSLSENRGADIVFEVSGAADALVEAIRIAGNDGEVVVVSWYGTRPQNLDLSTEFHHRRTRIKSSQSGGINPTLGPLWSAGRRDRLAASMLSTLPAARLITHEYAIADAAEAYRAIDRAEPNLLQCIIKYH